MSFDYGSEHEVVEGGGNFKNPEVGDHSARLRDIIHIGLFAETYKGKKKKPAPYVVAVFELKEDTDFEDDGETPLTISKPFPLKKGDKAFMTKFLKALDPKGEASGFDDLIGAACNVNLKGSKETNDDGTPKYVNFAGLSGMSAKFLPLVDELVDGLGVGHVRLKDISEEAIFELHPVLEVSNMLMQSVDYAGSKAEAIIAEIRKDNPDFATAQKKESTGTRTEAPAPEAQPEVDPNMSEEEEF